ncbi:MAG: MBL fold metallo-hydrolase [Clostridia bacterium]|nr:MBL fold metallo-hydrolase [Clostridia bacterium]
MKIVQFTTGPLRVNSYLIFKEGAKDAVLVDAGGSIDKIRQIANQNGVQIKHLLLTHGHFDHVGAVRELQKEGVLVYLHENDLRKVQTDECLCGFPNFKIENFTPDVLLNGGEKLTLCGIDFQVLHTPGHTSGCVCYITDNAIFSGDTLFCGSFGRTDLGDGDIKVLANSIINKLFKLEQDYLVYPGHEESTTIEFEKERNPIFYYV